MGNVHRLQGRLLPHTHTKPIKKISEISLQGKTYQFKALPFGLSTAPLEFTVVAKEVKLMALQKGKRIHQTDLPCPAIDVPHRTVNSNRKAGPPRQTPCEAHTMAPKTKVEGPRITRKGDTSPHVAPPPLKMVTGGKQCAPRSTITPSKTCSAIVYRRIKRMLGRSLKRSHCKGNLLPSRKQATYKLSGT